MRYFFLLILVITILSVYGCASTIPRLPQVTAIEKEKVLKGTSLYRDQEEFDDAEIAFRIALEIDPLNQIAINTAIRRYKKEHRFYFLQGVIYKAMNVQKLADASFNKALEFSCDQEQQERYRRKLDKLM